jgi:hypothetical protein
MVTLHAASPALEQRRAVLTLVPRNVTKIVAVVCSWFLKHFHVVTQLVFPVIWTQLFTHVRLFVENYWNVGILALRDVIMRYRARVVPVARFSLKNHCCSVITTQCTGRKWLVLIVSIDYFVMLLVRRPYHVGTCVLEIAHRATLYLDPFTNNVMFHATADFLATTTVGDVTNARRSVLLVKSHAICFVLMVVVEVIAANLVTHALCAGYISVLIFLLRQVWYVSTYSANPLNTSVRNHARRLWPADISVKGFAVKLALTCVRFVALISTVSSVKD